MLTHETDFTKLNDDIPVFVFACVLNPSLEKTETNPPMIQQPRVPESKKHYAEMEMDEE